MRMSQTTWRHIPEESNFGGEYEWIFKEIALN
jgi:hypothetical protein